MAASAPLYQDKFVQIFADHISIKSYYFPFCRGRTINIGDAPVSWTTDKELGLGMVDRKGWGMGLNNIWWAPDRVREWPMGPRHLCIVITVEGDTFRKGFSVEDDEAALRALESVLPRKRQ
ncbi:unnamed protein product [Symbiodinium pilosum]|uniref:Uncharacterized protein n=1 Tax=Symbiodinium pilosum TaxID=2952 RepID=A0A812KLF7_SYMPI|nr:unnamed protein product [Symbiodinium pilosum]